MEALPPGTPPAGFFLSLLTESFAVRAFFGSLVAAGLSAAALRWHWVDTPRSRRLVVMAPILAAAAAAVASVLEAETYLPQLWIATVGGPSGQVLELLGELRVISNARGVDVLFLAWLTVVVALLSRRGWGAIVTRRLLRSAAAVPATADLQRTTNRLSAAMGARAVQVRLLDACPGGALTAGTRRPVVVVDPAFLQTLDDHEVEGLLAHEVAHVARRDSLLGLAVGMFCDVTFFLPTVHLVGRWLHREREESADEWASRHTRRPAALASGILKVWEGATPRTQALQACGAVPGRVVLAGASGTVSVRRPELSSGARTVAARVERLVTPAPVHSGLRQACELSVAALVIVAASVATLVVPRWIANELNAYSLAFGYVPPPAEPVESPAFATFRALAPVTDATLALHGYERTMSPDVRLPEHVSTCPCVETQAQWLAGVPAAAKDETDDMAWRSTANPTWDVAPAPGSVKARPLLTLPEARPQLGFFVVARQHRP